MNQNTNSSTILGLCVGILCVLTGCSAPDPFSGSEYERTREMPALPFAVKVNKISFEPTQGLDATGAEEQAPNPDKDHKPAAIADEDNETKNSEIQKSVVKALRNYKVFSLISESDDELKKLGLYPPDLELTVSVHSPPPSESLGDVDRTPAIWANLFLWLLLGVPGWIIEDTTIDQRVDIKYALFRPGDINVEKLATKVDLDDAKKLNFLRRAGAWQYVYQIIIPPFLVGSERETADRSLYANYVSEVQSGMSRKLKEGFYAQARSREPIMPLLIVASPRETAQGIESGDILHLLLFSDKQLEFVNVEFVNPELVEEGKPPSLLVKETQMVDRIDSDTAALIREVYGDSAQTFFSKESIEILQNYAYKYELKDASVLSGYDPCENCFLRVTLAFIGGKQETRTISRSGVPSEKDE